MVEHISIRQSTGSSIQLSQQRLFIGKWSLFLVLLLIDIFFVLSIKASKTQAQVTERILVGTGWRADGQVIAAATQEELWLYTSSGEPFTQLAVEPEFRYIYLAWHPTSDILAAAGLSSDFEARIYLWQVTGSPPNVTTALDKVIDVLPFGLLGMQWSPDTRLATTVGSSAFAIWDTASGTLVQQINLAHVSVDGIAWSPDGAQLAVSGSSDEVRIFSTDTYQSTAVLPSQTNHYPYALEWSPTGSQLAVSEGSTIYLWEYDANSSSYQFMTQLELNRGLVLWLDWQGKRLAGSTADNTITIWDTNTWEIVDNIPNGGDLRTASSFSLSPDGTQLAHAGSNESIAISTPGAVPALRYSQFISR